MSRTPHKRRSTYRVLPALALLTLTAGAVTACGDDHSSPEHAATSPASPEAGRSGVSRVHMITSDGHRVAFYVTPGNGHTIVLDSGGGEDSSQWKDIAPKLHADTGATVITYDRAGLGKSDVVPGPWKVQSAVSDLKSGLEQLGVTGHVTLVSHSQAGEIANYFARDNPKMLSGAVLVDANLPPFFTDQEIPRLVAASRPQVDAAKKDPGKPENRQLISTAEGFAPAHRAFHKVTWPDSVPATVMVSEKTPFDGSPVDARRWRDAAASFAQDGPGRTLVTVKGSSHEVPTDRPDLVLKEVEDMVAARH
ncbi:alpha/beta hydrolase [Actinoallomurus bryophytorum]|uniref:Pimeloyl-ACP methyl ester carboxylesterase n=1 Tax=Actinoallomurus bryophytorum TaxID=1490222 RepID=A0A543CSR1_9ACTN|nr:alpha/beta hydrolase [Actinoallomurus bryophytorum]TQM00059.1 pimeloyl-ACP methyl ester carboxylesterase [Actinoallomurus bryophytorum]